MYAQPVPIHNIMPNNHNNISGILSFPFPLFVVLLLIIIFFFYLDYYIDFAFILHSSIFIVVFAFNCLKCVCFFTLVIIIIMVGNLEKAHSYANHHLCPNGFCRCAVFGSLGKIIIMVAISECLGRGN